MGWQSSASGVGLRQTRYIQGLRPGISVRSAELAADKLALQACFKEAGVPIPFYAPVASPDNLKEILAEHGPRLDIKPCHRRGRRGIPGEADIVDRREAILLHLLVVEARLDHVLPDAQAQGLFQADQPVELRADLGRVRDLDEERGRVVLKIGSDVRMEFLKSSIAAKVD